MIHHPKTEQEFNDLVANKVVLVDFFATWCGPCRMLSEVIEEIDQEGHSGYEIVKVDVDIIPSLAIQYHVEAVPTLMMFHNGQVTITALGYLTKDKILDFVKK